MKTLMMFAAALSAALTPEAVAAWIDVLAHAFLVAIAVIGAMLTTLSPVLIKLLPLWLARIKDEKDRLAVETVSRAALVGATRFATVQKELLEKAQDPSSPGGVVITDEERKEAAAKAVLAGFEAAPKKDVARTMEGVLDRAVEDLKKNGTLKAVVARYGSLPDVRDALRHTIETKVQATAVATTIPTPEALIAPGIPANTLTDPPR